MTDDVKTPDHSTPQHDKKNTNLKLVGDAKTPVIKEVERPAFRVYESPTSVEGKVLSPGVWLHDVKQSRDGMERLPVNYRICDPLYVEYETQDTDTGSVGRLIRFKYRGKWIEAIVLMRWLASGNEVIEMLLDMGLAVEYKHRRKILDYIASHHYMDKKLEMTTKNGWHESGAFVLQGKVLGSDKVKYQGDPREANIFSARGTLEAWKDEVTALCSGNPVLILSVCCAFTGPLLSRLGVVGGGFHLMGDSSTGKTLCLYVAASVWGEPGPGKFATSWNATKNGYEISAHTRNETFLPVDEAGQADPRDIEPITYAWGNGGGRVRMQENIKGRPVMTWRLFFLSSGERTLSDHAEMAGNRAHAGAILRAVDINAGTRKHRAFDDTHGMTGEAFHRALTLAISEHYGHAGPALVEAIIADQGEDDIPALYEQLRQQFEATNAQASRVADRFCTVATAGEYAISKGILPWRKGTAVNACMKLFTEWEESVGIGNTEDRQILQGISDFIAAHGDSRFSSIKDSSDHAPTVHNRAGYYEQAPDYSHNLYLFSLPALKEAAKGFDKSRITLALQNAGALVRNEQGESNQQQRRLPGGNRAWFYVIDPEKLHTD